MFDLGESKKGMKKATETPQTGSISVKAETTRAPRRRGIQLYVEASDPKPSLDTRTLK